MSASSKAFDGVILFNLCSINGVMNGSSDLSRCVGRLKINASTAAAAAGKERSPPFVPVVLMK